MLPPARPIARDPWGTGSLVSLAAVIAATAVVLVAIGRRFYLGYDPAWHVFIATLESWSSFLREAGQTTHPLLYFLALRAAIDTLGDSLLAYRAVSIAANLLSVWLVGRLAARLTSSAWLGVVAAAAFGLSANAIEIGLEVRSYALAIALLLLAYTAYLDWLTRPPTRLPASRRLVFAVATSAAILTHYSALFFLGAAFATPAALWLCARRWRVRMAREARDFPLAAGLMFGLPVATAAAAYALHLERWDTRRLEHVPDFLWSSNGESWIGFVARNTRNLAKVLIPEAGHGVPRIILSLLLGALTVWGVTRRRFRRRPAMATVAMLVSMGALNVLAALADRYPFGGYMRHEFFLFPFALLAVVQGIEAARDMAPPAWSSRPLWAGASALCVAMSVWLWTSRYTVRTEPLMQPQIDAFRAAFGTPPLVLTDRFNFIALYSHHRAWKWNVFERDPAEGTLELWEVSRPPERFRVCRSPQWQLDLSRLPAYADIAACLGESDRVAVFRPQQHRMTPAWDVRQMPRLARELGARVGLVPTDVRLVKDDVYVAFRAADRTRPRP